MRKLFLFILLALPLLVNCTISELHETDDSPKQVTNSMSIQEAETAFKNEFSSFLKKSNNLQQKGKFSPGNYTPLWNQSTYSENASRCSYDVKIMTDRIVYAIVPHFHNGRSSAEKVNVYQKLVVVKNKQTDDIRSYIVSLIPDFGCDKGDRIPDTFSNCESRKGAFTGLAVYSSIGSELIIRIDRYDDGYRKDGIYIPSGDGTIKDRIVKATGMLHGISLKNKPRISVKSYGEDDWWEYDDNSNYYDIGDGYYADDNGDLYYDTDGDGSPDSMVIDDSYTDDSDYDDDDYSWMCDPNPDDSYDDENPWLDTDDDYDDYYNDDDYYDPYSGNYNDNDTSEPETGNDTEVKALPHLYGTLDYYQKRQEDFIKRFPNAKPPKYYSDYGGKYCERFNSEIKPLLSEDGKRWIDNVTIALQEKLDNILINNPNIELTPESLRQQAFESHVSAYIESGLLELYMGDKIIIFLSVDLDDLSKPEGINQVLAIMEIQVIYYKSHPLSAWDDARYLIANLPTIVSWIKEYMSHNCLTKGADVLLTEEQVFDLLFGQLIDYYEKTFPWFSLPDVY